MAAPRMLTTVTTSIAITEVEEARDLILSSFFNEAEKEALSKRHIRSTAGWFVLKQALCKLLKQTQIANLSEQNFTLQRTKAGRPYIENINVPLDDKKKLIEKVFVSISHTRTTAYGMAVYQE